ncbi:MAG: hypothetical protein CMJ31_08635, partial [Phycisphaerae bacterium]|nr:hypothetical protein [Phycisphaerae bacterium]
MATTAPHNAAEAIRAWPQNCAIAAVTRSGVTSFAAVADARRADLADALAGPPAALRRLVCLPYELGHALEPAAGPPTAPQDPTSRERAATDPRPLVIDLNPSPLPTTTGAAAPQPIDLIQPLRPTTARERYIETVRTVKGRIDEGDVYQVNL